MIDFPANLPPQPPSGETKTASSPRWQQGQVLTATVTADAKAKTEVMLNVGEFRLQAITPLPVKQGQVLLLQIEKLGDLPVLKIINEPLAQKQLVTQNLRGLLNLQNALPNLLTTAKKLDNIAPLPSNIKTLLTTISNNALMISPDNKPDIQAIKTAIQQSGVFFESILAKNPGAATIQGDLKGLLNRLLAALQATNHSNLPPGSQLSPQQTLNPVLNQALNQALTLNQNQSLPLTAIEPGQLLKLAIDAYQSGKINEQQLSRLLHASLPANERQILIELLLMPMAQQAQLASQRLSAISGGAILLLLGIFGRRPQGQRQAETLAGQLRLQPLLLELQQAVEQSLGRIQLHQLLPLAREPGQPTLLLFDLPLLFDDKSVALKIRYEEEASTNDEDGSAYRIELNFDLPELGPIQVDAHVKGKQISTRFITERADTGEQISAKVEHFETQLAAAGFLVSHIIVATQKITALDNQKDIWNDFNSHLVDEQA